MSRDVVARYGARTTVINEALLYTMGVSDERLDVIRASHVERLHIFAQMEVAEKTDLLRLAHEFDNLEFRQQKLWGFAQDCNYHRWFDVPHCGCSNRFNADLIGTPMRIVSLNCEVHGQLLVKNHDCERCSGGLPLGDGCGQISQWIPLDGSLDIQVVNVNCEVHGTPLATFTPPN